MKQNQSFYQLNLNSILDSIEAIGLATNGYTLALNSLENRVYRIGLDITEANDRWREILGFPSDEYPYPSSVVVKFYRPGRWSRLQIQDEHNFLYELASADIPVIAPYKNSRTGVSLYSTNSENPIFFTILPTLRGRIVEEFDTESITSVGRLLSRIHNVGSSNMSEYRITQDLTSYAKPALEFILDNNLLNNHSASRYESIAIKFFELYDSLSANMPMIRIHGDCHKGNLIVDGNRFTFLDFDDFMNGTVIQDLWMLIPSGDMGSDYLKEVFLEAYRELRDLPDSWLELIEPLRAIRFIYYSSWIARRWSDPSFPNAFPHFGSDSYWEKEIRDLEDLYNKI